MSKFAFAKNAPGLAFGGVAAVAAVLAGLYLSRTLFPVTSGVPAPASVVQVDEAVPDAAEPADSADAAVVVQPEPAPESVMEDAALAPEQDQPEQDQNVEESAAGGDDAIADQPATGNVPNFDIVRVAPDGRTLVAGSAFGAQLVRILLDGAEVGTATVDGQGKFVAFLELPSSDLLRVVSLVSEGDLGTVESLDQVIIAPSVQVAVAVTEPATDTMASSEAGNPGQTAETEDTATSVAAIPEAAADTVSDAVTGSAGAIPQADVATDVATADPGAEAPDVQVDGTEAVALAETSDLDAPSQQATGQEAPVVTAEGAVEMALAEPTDVEPSSPQATLPQVSRVDTPETPEIALGTQLSGPQTPEAPAVILSTEAGVQVLQTGGGAPQALDQIALDAITYEDAGSVALSGRGKADEFVRVYIDNEPLLTTEVTADGRWRADLPNVDSGTYTLRVDAVDSEGTVISRVESPFLREDPVLLAQAIARGEAASTIQVVTVQPGNTLWAIARDRYGEGPAYVRVFNANRDRIRDPDLIYPGQVFSIPN